MAHWSDCAVYNEPAYPNDKCDCGNDAPSPVERLGNLLRAIYGEDKFSAVYQKLNLRPLD